MSMRKILTISFYLLFSPNSNSNDFATVVFVPGIYNVKTEIILPNLHESLRYTTTQTRQCLDRKEASSVFPILSEASFVGCALVKNQSNTTQMEYNLVCSNSTAATGTAKFHIGEASFRATLDVKMGGKNMKFTQQVNGSLIGACG